MRSPHDDLATLLTGGNRVKDQCVDDGVGADSQTSGVRLILEASGGEHIPLDSTSALSQSQDENSGEYDIRD